jgi:hypothetical protein
MAFHSEEDGEWWVELNVLPAGRVRISFKEVVRARINGEEFGRRTEFLVGASCESHWLDQLRKEHNAKFGERLAVVLDDVKHYIVCGHDMNIGVLARGISWEKIS